MITTVKMFDLNAIVEQLNKTLSTELKAINRSAESFAKQILTDRKEVSEIFLTSFLNRFVNWFRMQ